MRRFFEYRNQSVLARDSGERRYEKEFNRLLERAQDRTSGQHRIGTTRLDDALDALAMARAAELAVEGDGFNKLPGGTRENCGQFTTTNTTRTSSTLN
jgi:hypothetical protein